MRSLHWSVVLAWAAAGCAALPSPATHIVHERRVAHRSPWKRGERIHRDAILPVRIGLTQGNLDKAYDHLMDVSHPTSANFGKHWTPQEVHDMFAPADEAVQAVREWLVEFGIDNYTIVRSENKGWLALDLPTREAERLFHTEYYEHEHVGSGKLKIGCDEYYVPIHIQKHVDYITPGVKFSSPLKRSLHKRNAQSRSSRKNHMPLSAKENHVLHTSPPRTSSLSPTLQNCGVNITPACIKALYKIPNANINDQVNSLGIYEDGDYYAQADLDLSFAHFARESSTRLLPCSWSPFSIANLYQGLHIADYGMTSTSAYVPQGTHPTPAFIDGAEAPVPQNSSGNTGESEVDLGLAYSLLYPQTVTLYQTDDQIYEAEGIESVYQGFLNTFLDALDGSYCNYTAYNITGDSPGVDPVYPDPQPGGYKGQLQCGVYTPTRVISISYGDPESDFTENYLKRQCNEFMKLALQGHTILVSSGDFGVAASPGLGTSSGCLGENSTVYNPSTPGDCPYITSVGATRLYANQTVNDPESAMQANLGGDATLFASSGGFSNYYSVPDYQKAAVRQYFAAHDPGLPYYYTNGSSIYPSNGTAIGENGGVYNRGGRGFPDISANGAALLAYETATLYHFYGTSLAAPIWAAIITLINQERTALGKGPVGFINPMLYTVPEVFHDIKNGSNPGCGSSGFSAVEGWDPVTGLGTPNYPELLELYKGFP